ncbi:MAG: SEL1-like repeat protein [Sphingomonadales bacterium]|nr:SEL1-like repeat protein [Sphingomonadales bacterium]
MGNASGCTAAGMLYSLGQVDAKGFPPQPDFIQAFGYNRRACDLDPGKCWYLADHYWKGEGVALNLATAEALYRRSCKASPKYGCSSTAEFLDKTKRGQPGEIAALYEKACKNNNAAACRAAAVIYHNDKGVAKDRGKAESLRQLGCMMTGEEPCPPLDPAPAAAQAVAPKPSPAPPAAATARQAAPATAQAKRSVREPVAPGSALARGLRYTGKRTSSPHSRCSLPPPSRDPRIRVLMLTLQEPMTGLV